MKIFFKRQDACGLKFKLYIVYSSFFYRCFKHLLLLDSLFEMNVITPEQVGWENVSEEEKKLWCALRQGCRDPQCPLYHQCTSYRPSGKFSHKLSVCTKRVVGKGSLAPDTKTSCPRQMRCDGCANYYKELNKKDPNRNSHMKTREGRRQNRIKYPRKKERKKGKANPLLKLHEVKETVLPRLLGDQVFTDVRLGRKRAAIFDVEFFQLHDTQEVMVYEMSLVDENTGDVIFHTYVNPTITVNGEVFYSGLNGVSVGTMLKKICRLSKLRYNFGFSPLAVFLRVHNLAESYDPSTYDDDLATSIATSYPNQVQAMQSLQNMIAFYNIEVIIHHGINPEPYLLRNMSVELLNTYRLYQYIALECRRSTGKPSEDNAKDRVSLSLSKLYAAVCEEDTTNIEFHTATGDCLATRTILHSLMTEMMCLLISFNI